MPEDTSLGVLLVDDDPSVLQELAAGLSHAGFRVFQADGALSAADVASCDSSVGVVIADLRMPGEDGVRLAERLHASRRTEAALEVVLMSGQATLPDVTRALRAGVCDLLQKPFRLADLIQATNTATARAQRRRREAAEFAAAKAQFRDDEHSSAVGQEMAKMQASGNMPGGGNAHSSPAPNERGFRGGSLVHDRGRAARVASTSSEIGTAPNLPASQEVRLNGFDQNLSGDRQAAVAASADTASVVRAAVASRSAGLAFQPIIHLASGRLLGFEALLRLRAPDNTVIAADQAIVAAAGHDLLAELDHAVLHSALRQLSIWLPEFPPGMRLNVNTSPPTLAAPGFVSLVAAALREHDVPATRLRLEITEGHAMDVLSLRAMFALRDAGVAFAVDDFGSGYSSLSRLRDLPAESVKLDRSFFRGAGRSARDPGFLSRIVELAHSLCLSAVAEGIETADDLSLALGAGFDAGQGYLLGRPGDASSVTTWLQQDAADRSG